MALQELNAEELVLVNGGGRTSINPWGLVVGYIFGEILDGIQDGIDRYNEEGCETECIL